MIIINNALINNIERSEEAYKVYKKGLTYHQALHIFYANTNVYKELNHLLSNYDIDQDLNRKIFDYIFHLEDWFLQFLNLEKEVTCIEETFCFPSLRYSIPYPSKFLSDVIKCDPN